MKSKKKEKYQIEWKREKKLNTVKETRKRDERK